MLQPAWPGSASRKGSLQSGIQGDSEAVPHILYPHSMPWGGWAINNKRAHLHVQYFLEGFCVAIRKEFDVVVNKYHQWLMRGHHHLPTEETRIGP